MLAGCWWRERRTMRLDAMPGVVQVGSCVGTRYSGLIIPWSPTLEGKQDSQGPEATRTGESSFPCLDPAVCSGPQRGARSQWDTGSQPGAEKGVLGQHCECAPGQVARVPPGRLLCSSRASAGPSTHKTLESELSGDIHNSNVCDTTINCPHSSPIPVVTHSTTF